jgi:hypothetical protein
MGRVTAVFDKHQQAEAAVTDLKSHGATDGHVGIVARHDESMIRELTGPNVGKTAADTALGGLAGVGIGTIIGMVAAFIPGVGPFIAAGTIGSSLGLFAATGTAVATGTATAVAGGAAGGAIAGGAFGSVIGALTKAGYEQGESEFYARRIEEGGILVAADSSKELAENDILAIMELHHGHIYEE